MCIQKIIDFFKPKPPQVTDEFTPVSKRVVTHGINDYQGDDSDLRGCLNDQLNVVTSLAVKSPGFENRMYSDNSVTVNNFLYTIDKAIAALRPGDHLLIHYSGHGTQKYDRNGDEHDGYDEALYLYDGILIDDRIHELLIKIPEGAIVVVLLDSCFSGTATRASNPIYNKPRFKKTKGLFLRRRTRKRLFRSDENADKGFGANELPWIVISGCGEQQTSSDAFINGNYNGAFTFYAMKALEPGMTYRTWFEKIRTYLPSSQYTQAPELEGRADLLDRKVFE
jgi:hypothetical protein